jgi:hypothetical protein
MQTCSRGGRQPKNPLTSAMGSCQLVGVRLGPVGLSDETRRTVIGLLAHVWRFRETFRHVRAVAATPMA